MLHSRYFIVDKCYSVFFPFKNLLVSQCITLWLFLSVIIILLSLLLFNIISARSFYNAARGRPVARPATPVGKKTPPTPFLSLVRLWTYAGGGGNGDTHPADLSFFSSSSRRFVIFPHLITKRGTGVSFFRSRSSRFLMINNRETLAVVATEFSLKREFRKIQCPLFFSLFLSHLSYIYTYLYIYILYI